MKICKSIPEQIPFNRFNIRLNRTTSVIEKVLHSWSSQSNMNTFGKNLRMYANFSPSVSIWAQYLTKQCINPVLRPFLSSPVYSEVENKWCSSFCNSRWILSCHTILESSCYKLSNGASIASFDAWLSKLSPYESLRTGLPVWPRIPPV